MIRQEGLVWVVYADDGQELGRFPSREEAETHEQTVLDRASDVSRDELQAATRTSETLDERPFVIDDVELEESQVRSIANLVAGCSRRGPRKPMELRSAVDLWKRHNHVVTEGARRRWRVHRPASQLASRPLQWSRGQKTAETRVPDEAETVATLLQWSRGQKTAETQSPP